MTANMDPIPNIFQFIGLPANAPPNGYPINAPPTPPMIDDKTYVEFAFWN